MLHRIRIKGSSGSGSQQVLTLEQLTPAKLLELQQKGLIQISAASGDSPAVQMQGNANQGTIHIAVNPANILRNNEWTNNQPTITPYDACVVCNDKATGRHYGAKSCEGCKGFFKRSIRKSVQYVCRRNQDCPISKPYRNRCQYCRLQKCVNMGMRPDSVQCERSPYANRDRENLRQKGIFSGLELEYRKEMSNEYTINGNQIKNIPEHTSQGNLSTLANVVSTIANMNKADKKANEDQSSVHDVIKHGDIHKLNKTLSVGEAIANLHNSMNNQTSAKLSATTHESTQQTAVIDFEGSLMLPANFEFNLVTPTPVPEVINVQHICETASRLLFASTQWARGIFAFNILSDFHTVLLRECWNELFVLGLAQCGTQMKLDNILSTIIQHLQSALQQGKLSLQRTRVVMDYVIKLQEFITQINKLELDKMEFAFMKVLALFSPDHVRMKNKPQIQRFLYRGITEFRRYENTKYPNTPNRLSTLLLRLPALRMIDASITEELFFAGLIESVQIDSIIPHILKMNPGASSNAWDGADDSNSSDTNQENSTNENSLPVDIGGEVSSDKSEDVLDQQSQDGLLIATTYSS